jgi:hypothetical protein
VKDLHSGESVSVPYDGGDPDAIAAEIRRLLAKPQKE